MMKTCMCVCVCVWLPYVPTNGPNPRAMAVPIAARPFTLDRDCGWTARFCVIDKAAFQLLKNKDVIPFIKPVYSNTVVVLEIHKESGRKMAGDTHSKLDTSIVLCNPKCFMDTEKMKYWHATKTTPDIVPINPIDFSSKPSPPTLAIANNGKVSLSAVLANVVIYGIVHT